jgi:hypothetical protein
LTGARAQPALNLRCRRADAMHVMRPISTMRRPGALTIATLAVFDLAYRVLLRGSVRRRLGMRQRP